MRLIFYIFVFSQLFNLLDVLADKIKNEPGFNRIKWERVETKKSNNLKIIWKSYNDDEIYFERNKNNIENNSDKHLINKKKEKTKYC